MRTTIRWSAVLTMAAGAASCSTPTAACDGSSGISGEWTYQATQDAPAPATIRGSMVITSRSCADFQGVLDLVEVLATGESRRVGGPVSGTMLDSTLLRFEAIVAGLSREHLARIRSDSISGDWVQAAGGAAGSGRFAGQRVGPK